MTRFYITTICIQIVLIIFLINMYETKINELESTISKYSRALDKARSPYAIQHSIYCSDSWLLQ